MFCQTDSTECDKLFWSTAEWGTTWTRSRGPRRNVAGKNFARGLGRDDAGGGGVDPRGGAPPRVERAGTERVVEATTLFRVTAPFFF